MNTGPHPSASLPLPISEASGPLSLSLSLSPLLSPHWAHQRAPVRCGRRLGEISAGFVEAGGRASGRSPSTTLRPGASRPAVPAGAAGCDADLAAGGWGEATRGAVGEGFAIALGRPHAKCQGNPKEFPGTSSRTTLQISQERLQGDSPCPSLSRLFSVSPHRSPGASWRVLHVQLPWRFRRLPVEFCSEMSVRGVIWELHFLFPSFWTGLTATGRSKKFGNGIRSTTRNRNYTRPLHCRSGT